MEPAQVKLNRRLAVLLSLYVLTCSLTACCYYTGFAAPLEWMQPFDPVAGQVDLSMPSEPWLDSNSILIKARFSTEQTYVYDIAKNKIRSSSHSYYDPPAGTHCGRLRPDQRPRIRAFLTSSDRTAEEICTAPAGDRVIVITRIHTAESSRAELFVFDSQGQMVNRFDKFDLVRSKYWDFSFIDLNLYYLSIVFTMVSILSGGAALYYLVKARHFATIALILMLTCMCAPCVAISYMYSWLPP